MTEPAVPVLREHRSDAFGDRIDEWYCRPPEPGVEFVVERAEWAGDVRRILEVRLLGVTGGP